MRTVILIKYGDYGDIEHEFITLFYFIFLLKETEPILQIWYQMNVNLMLHFDTL